DLSQDLRAYVATIPAGEPVFPLTRFKGAEMLRVDLAQAGIPYRDEGGLVFDFHSLRCQTATLLDAAGVSPRVAQRIMRHSKEELTNRYTRPRVADLDAAIAKLPNLRPQTDDTERRALAATGTDPRVRTDGLVPKSVLTEYTARRKSLTGEGLEPSTNGLTCLIGFHRPSRLQ